MIFVFLLVFMSFSIAQSLIQTKEYAVYKDNNLKEINILELISEKEGTFKVELIDIKDIQYDRIKKILVLPCELEMSLSSKISKNSIEYKLCNGKIESLNYLLVDKKNPTIKLSHEKFKYVNGNMILHISGEYKNYHDKSYNLKDNGVLREWHSNGQLSLEFNMKNAIKNGECKKWYDNGQQEIIYNYISGKLHGKQRKWYPNGNQRAEWNYLKDQAHGIFKEWYENGKIKFIKQYSNGELVSIDESYDSNGNPN